MTTSLTQSDLTANQQAAIDALYERNTLLIAPKGFGKAVVGQTAIQALINDDIITRCLVAAPLKVCQLTWAAEWKKWNHLWEPALAIGDAQTRRQAAQSSAEIVIINVENVAWLAAEGLLGEFDGLLIDELTKFKAVGAACVKALRGPRGRTLKQFAWRAGLTASPIAEAGTDIYSQMLLVDAGAALGTNMENFRRKYFYPTDYEQRNWALMPGMGSALADRLKGSVYVVEDPEYSTSLPVLVENALEVEMPPAAWDYYRQMCEMRAIEIDGVEIEAVNAGVLSGKLTQIAAGAIYDKDSVAHWIHDAKLEALQQAVRDAEGPVAVAYQFQFELAALRALWPDIAVLGDDPVRVEAEWNAGRIAVMALHPRSASHGLNLQYGGHELIDLSGEWGADPDEQIIGRFRRRGQKSGYVTRTRLVVTGTIDELIISRNLMKGDAENILMGHIQFYARNNPATGT